MVAALHASLFRKKLRREIPLAQVGQDDNDKLPFEFPFLRHFQGQAPGKPDHTCLGGRISAGIGIAVLAGNGEGAVEGREDHRLAGHRPEQANDGAGAGQVVPGQSGPIRHRDPRGVDPFRGQEGLDRRHGLGGVFFMGHMAQAWEHHQLAASDVFVLPTLTEALPTVLAEAMALGLPIVASAVGGIPEMVSNGRNGYLVNPRNPSELADVCRKLLSSPESRTSMGDEGLEIVQQKFNIETQVRQMRELYLDLLRRYGK